MGLKEANDHPTAARDQRSGILRRLKSKFRKSLAVGRLLGYDLRNSLRPRARQYEHTHGQSLFFPLCFACSKHFELLRIALRSLNNWALPIKEITIYMDKKDPFSAEQRHLLQTETQYPLKFQRTIYPMSPPGPRVVLNELHAFRRLAEQMRARDFLLKFDSDVIFLSDSIFKFVLNAGAQAVGTCVTEVHPTLHDKFMQGGSYFIVGSALRKLVDTSIATTGFSLLRRHTYLSEDQFISTLLHRSGAKIIYNTFIYSDAILAEPGLDDIILDSRLLVIPKTASVLHFEGNKSNMRRAAERLIPDLPAIWMPSQQYSAYKRTTSAARSYPQ
jgi:hypothetical protein